MNICANCRHFAPVEPESSPRYACDYNLRCSAFDGELIPALDPVLGRVEYSRRNDLGGRIPCATAEEARPLCRGINPNGECDRWTPIS